MSANTSDGVPWWTDPEIIQDDQNFDEYLTYNPEIKNQLMAHYDLEKSSDYRGYGIRWLFFKASDIDKFKNHKFVDHGYNEDEGYPYLRWLNTDSSGALCKAQIYDRIQ
jgi:hypothetical protein